MMSCWFLNRKWFLNTKGSLMQKGSLSSSHEMWKEIRFDPPPPPVGVSTNHTSLNRIHLSQLVQELFHFLQFLLKLVIVLVDGTIHSDCYVTPIVIVCELCK